MQDLERSNKNREQTTSTISIYAPNRKIPKKPKNRVINPTTSSKILDLGFTVKHRKAHIVSIVGQFILPNGE